MKRKCVAIFFQNEKFKNPLEKDFSFLNDQMKVLKSFKFKSITFIAVFDEKLGEKILFH